MKQLLPAGRYLSPKQKYEPRKMQSVVRSESRLLRYLVAAFLVLTIHVPVAWAIVPVPQSSATIKVGVAQIGMSGSTQDNLQKIVSFMGQAAAEGCRVVVFPEGVLRPVKEPSNPDTVTFLEAIQAEAAADHIYVLLGILSKPVTGNEFNWMVVINPEGQEIHRYPKLYDNPNGELPKIFYIDGIPCSAVLCADRWLRGVTDLPIIEGAQISFELSLNFKSEWVPDLEWFWYVPRALRHNVFVVFSNTAASSTYPDNHGHSAIIGPHGDFLTRTYANDERLLTATLDMTEATGQEAGRRRDHKAFGQFWDAGKTIRDGGTVSVSSWSKYSSTVVPVRIAAVQMAMSHDRTSNVAKMVQKIAEAKSNGADVVVFPELAVTGGDKTDIQSTAATNLSAALSRIQKTAKSNQVYVIFGMPRIVTGGWTNAAYVIDPNGTVLTTYDQMAPDRTDVFKPGSCPSKMWFKLKGAYAVVTIGRDRLWTEISEMCAYAGVQLLFNISYDLESGPEEDMRDLQLAESFASYFTFTAQVNAAASTSVASPSLSGSGQSSLWEDLTGYQEMQAGVKHTSWSKAAEYEIFAYFAANCIVKAGKGEEILYATRTVNQKNPFKEDSKNTRMKPWYWYGAKTVTSCF